VLGLGGNDEDPSHVLGGPGGCLDDLENPLDVLMEEVDIKETQGNIPTTTSLYYPLYYLAMMAHLDQLVQDPTNF